MRWYQNKWHIISHIASTYKNDSSFPPRPSYPISVILSPHSPYPWFFCLLTLRIRDSDSSLSISVILTVYSDIDTMDGIQLLAVLPKSLTTKGWGEIAQVTTLRWESRNFFCYRYRTFILCVCIMCDPQLLLFFTFFLDFLCWLLFCSPPCAHPASNSRPNTLLTSGLILAFSCLCFCIFVLLYCTVLCCAVLCRAVPCYAVPCRAVLCCTALCRAVMRCTVCCYVLCCVCISLSPVC
jgi:hypothetical protein